MQNFTSAVASFQAINTVVKNDTTTLPSIKLAKLSVPATISIADSSTQPAQTKLSAMEKARMSWETTELAASNKRLYSILKDAYSFYLVLKLDPIKETRAQYAEEISNFIDERKYTFMPSTHDMTRVVKCVFGVDRRRVSAYSIALREALRQCVSAADLVEFIDINGGVEQIRLGGSKPLSVKKRAEQAKDEVLAADLGNIKFDQHLFAGNPDWTDKQVVIVATYLPTGEFQANAVVRHDGAVNSALAAFYSLQKSAEREAVKSAAENEKNAAKAEAAEKAKVAEQDKTKKVQKQKDSVQKELATDAQKASYAEHFDSLLEKQTA